MANVITYMCEDCGHMFEWEDLNLIYRKDGKIIETKCLSLTSCECAVSDLQAKALITYCENCEKIIKVYTLDGRYDKKDAEKYSEEVKEFMKHKRPKNTIQTFMEDVKTDNISCPQCNKEIPLDFEFKKCTKCGSENLKSSFIILD